MRSEKTEMTEVVGDRWRKQNWQTMVAAMAKRGCSFRLGDNNPHALLHFSLNTKNNISHAQPPQAKQEILVTEEKGDRNCTSRRNGYQNSILVLTRRLTMPPFDWTFDFKVTIRFSFLI